MGEKDKEDYSPYCPDCEACGEEGCCSPLNCRHTAEGHYCKSYLKDLHFAYLMHDDLYNLVCNDEKYKEKIKEIWDKNYIRIYK